MLKINFATADPRYFWIIHGSNRKTSSQRTRTWRSGSQCSVREAVCFAEAPLNARQIHLRRVTQFRDGLVATTSSIRAIWKTFLRKGSLLWYPRVVPGENLADSSNWGTNGGKQTPGTTHCSDKLFKTSFRYRVTHYKSLVSGYQLALTTTPTQFSSGQKKDIHSTYASRASTSQIIRSWGCWERYWGVLSLFRDSWRSW